MKKLFGLFDHVIDLHLDDRITIIHAPNGYGKTVLLKIVSGFFGGSLSVLRSYDYDTINFEMEKKEKIKIAQVSTEASGQSDGDFKNSYRIEYTSGNQKHEWSPDDIDPDMARSVAPSSFERFIPGLRQIAPRLWRNHAGERMSYDEVVERYWAHLPISAQRGRGLPDWLETLRTSVNCRLIETQRLMIQKHDPHRPERESPMVLAVQTYSEGLALAINRTLAESATLSQSLDRTFPNRILAKMRRPPQLDERAVRKKLSDLEAKRARLAKVDLLEKSDEGALVSHRTFDEAALRILGEYALDAEKKLGVFDTLLAKIELFIELLNGRFRYKTVTASRESGFVFSNVKGNSLSISSLSSGEQHEFILLYNLIFRTNPDALLLIDEPEISLHIAWQKKFLSDLRRVISLSPMDIILATHSPQIISGNLDLTVQLKGPRDVRTRP